MRKENVATGPPSTMKERKYLSAKTFCLGFPRYKGEAFRRTLEVIEAVRAGKIPYRGRGIASRNQIIKDLVVYGLALSGNRQALSRMKQKGFLPESREKSEEEVTNGHSRSVTQLVLPGARKMDSGSR
jgi:hypothetical protein